MRRGCWTRLGEWMKIRKGVVRGRVVLCESVSRRWSNEEQREKEKEREREEELREVDKAN